jgi:hypothetical protein
VTCGQLLLLTLRENGAVGVDIALHVMIPCGKSLALDVKVILTPPCVFLQ